LGVKKTIWQPWGAEAACTLFNLLTCE